MKKALLTLALLLAVVLSLAACGGSAETTTASTTAAETTGVVADGTTAPVTATTTTPSTTPVTSAVLTDTPGVTTTPDDPNVEPIVSQDYTAIPNNFEWVNDSKVDFSKFNYTGAGTEVTKYIDTNYNGYNKTYLLNGAEVKKTDVRKLATLGAIITSDKSAKTVTIELQEITAVVESSWKSVTAKAGSYLMFEFTTNLTSEFCVTVTAEEGASASKATYKQPDITVSGKDGKNTGTAKCTVPSAVGKTYYINICIDDGASYPVLKSIPVTITTPRYDSEFSLIFTGDWELVI